MCLRVLSSFRKSARGRGTVDYDDDGFLDVFAVNGTRVEETPEEAFNRLYRNTGAAGSARVFREVTQEAGLKRSGWGMGCAAGDYDNDGDVDLLVVNLNDVPTLLRNDGGNQHNWLGLELLEGGHDRHAIGPG